MIRPLRQRHRAVFIALGFCLPLAFASGIAARRPIPPAASLPATLASTPPAPADLVWKRRDLFPSAPIEVRLLREKSSGRIAAQFSATTDFLKPDLLVYWAAGNPHIRESLPENATLLGQFDSPALILPNEVLTVDGVLILYSLADNELVGMTKPLRLVDSTQ